MKKLLFYFLIFLIPGNIMSQPISKPSVERKPTIAILDSFANAFNAHDADKILSYMTDDCMFEASAGADVDGEKFVGRQAVKKAFEDIFRNYPDDHRLHCATRLGRTSSVRKRWNGRFPVLMPPVPPTAQQNTGA